MNRVRWQWLRIVCTGLIPLLLLVTACGQKTVTLTQVFPDAEELPDWAPSGDVETYDRSTLFDLVNGQADAFFVYNFEQVAVQRYESSNGERLDIEVWQLATPADAYGLFSVGVAGDPIDFGNGGDIDPGRRMTFWQDRYYVQVRARQQLLDCDPHVFAEAVAAALPSGGEAPGLLNQLPAEGLVEPRAIFFHEEISIQDYVWLGGENLLGLGPETNGVLGRYDFSGIAVRLLLVQYPDSQSAAAGLEALRASDVSQLAASDVNGELLSAVLGEVDATTAAVLLAGALVK